jgi:hypothetical protein
MPGAHYQDNLSVVVAREAFQQIFATQKETFDVPCACARIGCAEARLAHVRGRFMVPLSDDGSVAKQQLVCAGHTTNMADYLLGTRACTFGVKVLTLCCVHWAPCDIEEYDVQLLQCTINAVSSKQTLRSDHMAGTSGTQKRRRRFWREKHTCPPFQDVMTMLQHCSTTCKRRWSSVSEVTSETPSPVVSQGVPTQGRASTPAPAAVQQRPAQTSADMAPIKPTKNPRKMVESNTNVVTGNAKGNDDSSKVTKPSTSRRAPPRGQVTSAMREDARQRERDQLLECVASGVPQINS